MDRVYVGNLPPDIRIKDIDDFFRAFGKLVSIDVNNRSNPAYAYVQFDNERNAINAVRSRCGYNYEGYTLQVKLVDSLNDRGFEVRNQRRQATPPPPPPMFNDYSFGNNDFRNNNLKGFGNSEFGSNVNNQGNTNFLSRPASLFQSSVVSPQNMQYPNRNMTSKNMIEYPITSRRSDNTNIGGGGYGNRSAAGFDCNVGNFDLSGDSYNRSGGAGFDRSGGSFDGFDRSGGALNLYDKGFNRNDSGFNRNASGFNRNDSGFNRNDSGFNPNDSSFNRNDSGFNRNDSGFNRNDSGFNRNDSSFNRTDSGFNRNDSSFNRNDSGFNRNESGFNRDDNRYNDETFEDIFTQGLSGSGRKWFNRYIRKGFAANIARAKALEHRTVPYLRGGPNEIPNNPVANMPLPALETIGNQIISLLGTGGVDNFGGNGNQMTSNFSNWGGDKFQGDVSNNLRQNQFNMSGRNSSNYDEHSSMSKRAGITSNRDGRPEAKKGNGVLEKMLEGIPTYNQRKVMARKHYQKSLTVLAGLQGKRGKDYNERQLVRHHKSIVKDFEELFKTAQPLKDLPGPRRGPRGATVQPTATQLKQEYQRKKTLIYEEARRMPDFPRGVLSDSAGAKVRLLVRQGFELSGAKVLARLPLAKVKQFVSVKIEYETNMKKINKAAAAKKAAAKNPTTTTTTVTKTAATETAAASKTDVDTSAPTSDQEAAYKNNIKLLKKYEESKTINDNIKRLLVTCLKKVREYEELNKLPKTSSKFEDLLPKVATTTAAAAKDTNENENENDAGENENENENDAGENENDDEENEEQNEENKNDEDEEEGTADQNDEEDNGEFQQDENDEEPNEYEDDAECAEDQNDDENNAEFDEDQNNDENDAQEQEEEVEEEEELENEDENKN